MTAILKMSSFCRPQSIRKAKRVTFSRKVRRGSDTTWTKSRWSINRPWKRFVDPASRRVARQNLDLTRKTLANDAGSLCIYRHISKFAQQHRLFCSSRWHALPVHFPHLFARGWLTINHCPGDISAVAAFARCDRHGRLSSPLLVVPAADEKPSSSLSWVMESSMVKLFE
jgi:hypothetical protein